MGSQLFPSRWSRRQLLLAGAAGAGTLAAGGALWLAAARPRELVVALLQRALPGVTIDHASALECADDVMGVFEGPFVANVQSQVKLKGVRVAGQAVGLDRVAHLGPVEDRLDEITRLAVTRFLLNSNFFQVPDPRAATIVYRRPDPNAACRNPWADLSPPA